MKIQFVSDFRGRETGEQFYRKGEQADLPTDAAEKLVADGRAVMTEPAADEQPAPVKGRRK